MPAIRMKVPRSVSDSISLLPSTSRSAGWRLRQRALRRRSSRPRSPRHRRAGRRKCRRKCRRHVQLERVRGQRLVADEGDVAVGCKAGGADDAVGQAVVVQLRAVHQRQAALGALDQAAGPRLPVLPRRDVVLVEMGVEPPRQERRMQPVGRFAVLARIGDEYVGLALARARLFGQFVPRESGSPSLSRASVTETLGDCGEG